MPLPLRIAILETDTPLDKTRAKYGGYGGVFKVLLKKGAQALGKLDPENDLKITPYHVVNHPETYPNLEDIDAILITGSRHDAFAETPWINTLVDFTAKVLAQKRVRVIGVCFGHQIVGRAMGVKVGRNDAWEAAVHEVTLSERGKQILGLETLHIHQMHRDIVFTLPSGVEPLGSSPVCEVQGMYESKRLFTIQGHPEFTQQIVQEILDTRYQTGVFTQEDYDHHVAKVAHAHDGVAVSKAFIQFLLD